MSLTSFDLIPVFGVVVTIAGISLKAGRILQKLDNVIDDAKEIKVELKAHERSITTLENKIDAIEKRLAVA